MKSYTTIEQSRKLAEILPLESADRHYVLVDSEKDLYSASLGKYIGILPHYPAWSLASLLGVLPYPQLSKDKLGSGKVGWMVSVYTKGCRYDSCWHDNPVDACYEMIIKLKERELI